MHILTEQNFIIYAAQNYKNSNCADIEEFNEDLNRIKYIKKLFNVYENRNELNLNLIMNHLIIMYNMFDSRACTRMLFFRLPEYMHYLRSTLYFTGHLPDMIFNLHEDGSVIELAAIQLDTIIVNRMKEILKEQNDNRRNKSITRSI